MFIAILTLLSALSISGVAIFYSVIGLATIFPGAFVPVVIMGGVLEVGKQAGTITNPVAQFSVGAAVLAGTVLATAKGTADNKNQSDNTVITNANPDTANILTADESFNLVSNDENIRDQIAAGIYYKDIGSRKNLSIAESDVEYEGSSDNVKTVYTNKSITDIRKLVTEGYIRIERQTQNVEIATEKATL